MIELEKSIWAEGKRNYPPVIDKKEKAKKDAE